MIPSHGWRPSSSPPTASSSSIMRPSEALDTTTSLTATVRPSGWSSSRVGSSTTSYSPAKTRPSPSSSSRLPIELRKPTRPKLTPITGTPLPRKRASARSTVPSPPRTTAMSAACSSAASTPCFCASSSESTSSTPWSCATACRRAKPAPIWPGFPWVTTAARATRLPDGIGDPALSVIGVRFAGSVSKMDEELPVPLGAGQPGVYDPDGRRTPRARRFDDPSEHVSLHRGVTDDALRDLATACFELRLDEDERLPPRRGEREHRRKRLRDADERHVADDEVGGERELGQCASVHPLEHDDTRVGAQSRMQLPVAHIDRGDACGARLQEAVGEPAGRGADVRAV